MLDLTKNYPIEPRSTWNVQDSSKIQTYLDCPRQYFYSYVLGWKPETPNNHLVFGEAWHEAMEELLLKGYNKEAINSGYAKFLKVYRKTFAETTDDLFGAKNPNIIREALAYYCVVHQNDSFKVLHTEVSGSSFVTLDGDQIFFRIDAIVEDERGIFSLEHKTTSRFSKQWQMQWVLSIQVGTYCHALYSVFGPEKTWGIIVNGFAFQKFDILRVPVRKTPLSMQNWLHTVQDVIYRLNKDFTTLLNEDSPSHATMKSFPLNPCACTKYFGCPYHDYCYSWDNPLKRASAPPSGFIEDHWDPRNREDQAKANIVGEKIIKKEETNDAGTGS